MRNPFRRHCPACGWANTTPDPAAHAFDCAWIASRRLTSEERYAVTDADGHLLGHEPMPADWPAFTANLFERRVFDSTGHPDAPTPPGHDPTTDVWHRTPDAWDHVDAVLAEHPAVTDLRRTLDHINRPDRPDPLEAHAALVLQRHEEDQAYNAGRRMYYWGENFEEQSAIDCARLYLRDDPEHGAHLAALVLAGYTGTPRELIR